MAPHLAYTIAATSLPFQQLAPLRPLLAMGYSTYMTSTGFPSLHADLSESLAEAAFRYIDVNNDGSLSRDEFLNTVMDYYSNLEPSAEKLNASLFLGK